MIETGPLPDPGPASTRAEALGASLSLSITVSDILDRRGLMADSDTERYLDPKLAHLTVPDQMADREACTDRIARAIRAKETICVFGDYDCDGITSAAIMTSVIRSLGGIAVPRLATRQEGAYGLSFRAMDRVLATGATLLITCDCGSSDHERIAFAREKGVETVVIDHHLVPKETLPSVAFLNPHRPDCGFAYKGLASCGLALSIGAALRKELKVDLDVRQYLDLVAIGTIADVAPLTGDNRALVRAGLSVLGAGRRTGLRALADLAKIKLSRGVTAEDVAFRIAPRLNAPGRLADPDPALELLLCDNAASAMDIAATVEQLTLKRRTMQAEMVEQADADIEQGGLTDGAGLVLARKEWHPGIVGIVAGRLADTHQRPTIVIGLEGETGRGSVRGPSGFPLHDALTRCKETMVGFGGHQAAAGVEVHRDRVLDLRAAWNEACTALEVERYRGRELRADVRLDPRDDPFRVVMDLARIEPCGEQNPAALVLLSDVSAVESRDLKGHLKLGLALNDGRSRARPIGAVAFHEGEHAQRLSGAKLDVVGRLRQDHFRGGDAVEMHIERIGIR